MFCPNCGTKNLADAKFCESCGTNLANAAPAAPPVQAAPPPPVAPPPPPTAVPVYQQQQQRPPQYQQPAYAQPALDAPMSVGSYMLTLFLLGLPIAGFILMLVWAFGSNVNKNKKNLCRAMLIFALIGIVVVVLVGGALYSYLSIILSNLFAEAGYY